MSLCENPPVENRDEIRSTWTRGEIADLFALPLIELLYRAQTIHRRYHDPQKVQLSTLLSIKTGGCPEDCAYCPQSAHHSSGVEATKLMELEEVVTAAKLAKACGSTRFCMGAAWRSPKDRDLDLVCRMVEEVRGLGLETCVTLGMLTQNQAVRLKQAGLDFYNHNLDTAPESYAAIISTRTYQERLDTLAAVRAADINVCCGGILGMNEDVADRVGLIHSLASMPRHPESVPINLLVRVEGTPLEHATDLDPLEFVRAVAVARITMPASMVRLSAGRDEMSDETQCLCFLAGANSIFYGDKLLTTPNNPRARDGQLLGRLGMAFLDAPVAN